MNESIQEKEKMVGAMVPESVVEEVQKEATKEDRSLSAQVRVILKAWVEGRAR